MTMADKREAFRNAAAPASVAAEVFMAVAAAEVFTAGAAEGLAGVAGGAGNRILWCS
jgi:hypothetical protein